MEVKIELTPEQAALLKDELECLIECMYDSSMDNEWEELAPRLQKLVAINQKVCKAAGLTEADSGCYLWCKNDLASWEGKSNENSDVDGGESDK